MKVKQYKKPLYKQDTIAIYYDGHEGNSFSSNSMLQSIGKNSTTFFTPRLDQTRSSTNSGGFNLFRSRSNVGNSSKGEYIILSPRQTQNSFGFKQLVSRESSMDYIEEVNLQNSNKKSNESSNSLAQTKLQKKSSSSYDWQNKQNKTKIEYLKTPFETNLDSLRGTHLPYGNILQSNSSMLKLNYLLTGMKKPNLLLVPSFADIPDILNGEKPEFYQKMQRHRLSVNQYNKTFKNLLSKQGTDKKFQFAFKEGFFKKSEDYKEKNIINSVTSHNSNKSNPQTHRLEGIINNNSLKSSLTQRNASYHQKSETKEQTQTQEGFQFLEYTNLKLDKCIKIKPDSIKSNKSENFKKMHQDEKDIDTNKQDESKLKEMLSIASQNFRTNLQYAFLINEQPISLIEQIPDNSCKTKPMFWRRLSQYHKVKDEQFSNQMKENLIKRVNQLDSEVEIIQFLKDPKNFYPQNARKKYSILETLTNLKKQPQYQVGPEKFQLNKETLNNQNSALAGETLGNFKNERDEKLLESDIKRRFERQYSLADDNEIISDQPSQNYSSKKLFILEEVSKVIQSSKQINLITDELIRRKETDFQMSKAPITGQQLKSILGEIPKKKENPLKFKTQSYLKVQLERQNQLANNNFFKGKGKQQINILQISEGQILTDKQVFQEKTCTQEQSNLLHTVFSALDQQKNHQKETINYVLQQKNQYQNVLAEINIDYPNLVPHNIPEIEKKTGLTRQQLHLMFSKFKSLLHYKYLYQNGNKQTAKEIIKGGFDVNIFKKGVPKLSIAPDHAVEKLFFSSKKTKENTKLLWDQFLSALIILESGSEDSKIDLFLRIIDENENGFLSFQEIFNASKEVFKQILCETSNQQVIQPKRQSNIKQRNYAENDIQRDELLEMYHIQGDQFNHIEMSEFLARYIFDYLNCPYDQEIPTDLIKSKLQDQSKELDLLLMICFQDINQQPREEYDNSSDEEDYRKRQEVKQQNS